MANDSDLDAIVNCVNAVPQLLRCDSTLNRSWIKIRLVGTRSNRTGIGARLKVVAQTGTPVLTAKPGTPLVQIDEVRSCNGYYSASDLRIHFCLGDAKKVDMVEINWPSGEVNTLKELDVNRLYVIQEGGKILKPEALTPAMNGCNSQIAGCPNLASFPHRTGTQRASSCADNSTVLRAPNLPLLDLLLSL